MALISLDNLSINGQNEELVIKFKDKLSRYWVKVKKMTGALQRKNSQKELDKLMLAMKTTFDLYEPLAYLNSICYREGDIYTMKLQKRKECDEKYLQRVDNFRQAYYETSKIISKLRY